MISHLSPSLGDKFWERCYKNYQFLSLVKNLMCSMDNLYFIICRFVCSRAVEIIKAHRLRSQQDAWQKEFCTIPIHAMFAVVPYHLMT